MRFFSILLQMDISNFDITLCRFIRDVLRGEDSSGNPNGYTSYVHHTSDYTDLKNLVLKDSSEWISKKDYIIAGKLNKDTSGPVITVNYVGDGGMTLSAQNSDSYNVDEATIQILIDTTYCHNREVSERDRITSQVRETLAKNSLKLYTDNSYYDVILKTSDMSGENNFIKVIQIGIDLYLKK